MRDPLHPTAIDRRPGGQRIARSRRRDKGRPRSPSGGRRAGRERQRERAGEQRSEGQMMRCVTFGPGDASTFAPPRAYSSSLTAA